MEKEKEKYKLDGTIVNVKKREVDLLNFETEDDLVGFMQAMCNDVSEEDEAVLRALFKKAKGE